MKDTSLHRAPTMADVARRAGVSNMTVSRVLSGHPTVRAATRAAVLRAVEELGYLRNFSARALATRSTRALGVIACDVALSGQSGILSGLQEAARTEGYVVSTVTLRHFSAEDFKDAVDHLGGWGADGIVVVVPHRAAMSLLADMKLPFPVVAVEAGPDAPLTSASVDQELGARLVTRHLLDARHRTVWHVAGPADWLQAEARTAGWRRTLEDAGAQVPPPLVGDWTPLSGYRAGQELAGRVTTSTLRKGSPEVTAVFVANDQMALGVLWALREAGLSVPGKVAVAGFDDIPGTEVFSPPLTTVRQDFAAVGRAGVQLLVERLASGPAVGHRHIVLEPRLIARASTARRL